MAVLLTVEGDHVPDIPFVDIAGRTGAVAPLQMGRTGLKTGTTDGKRFMVADFVVLHPQEFVAVKE